MGHKTDGRRYAAKTEASGVRRQASGKKKLTAAEASKLAAAHVKALDAGKRGYKKADELFQQLLDGGVKVGQAIELAGGRTATIVDQFAGGKNKVYKPAGVARFVLDVKEE